MKSDFERIYGLLLRLGEPERGSQRLGELALELGLSADYLSRLFRRWVGISPSQFQRYLALEGAKERLRESSGVLEAALESGFSGPGRLHDAFIEFEAVTPGVFKAQGAGWEVRYGFVLGPFGEVLIARTERGICFLGFVEAAGREVLLGVAREGWERAEWVEDRAGAEALLPRLFPSRAMEGRTPLTLCVRGTNFQIRVWEALLRIPEGQLCSYGSLASRLGNPGAARAVGGAVGANKVAWIIPCHRVIRESGLLGGYRYGMERKRWMLAFEWAQEARLSDDEEETI